MLTLADSGERNGHTAEGAKEEEQGHVCSGIINSLRSVCDRNAWAIC